MRPLLLACTLAAISGTAFAADAPAPPLSKVFDSQVRQVESEIGSLAEAMPADKYDFAPTNGEFKTVRTFSLQMTHIATVIYEVSSAALGEKCPVATGKNENGDADIRGKDAVVKYLKGSFALAHRAANALTAANMMDMLQSPFGDGKTTRINLVSIIAWHSFDHYGQSVVYARMNKIVPPASR
ncbi:MAG: DinB family protein [Acidobacteriia bacterium]|nr:DinB family protein [Terriglobia bacterium]